MQTTAGFFTDQIDRNLIAMVSLLLYHSSAKLRDATFVRGDKVLVSEDKNVQDKDSQFFERNTCIGQQGMATDCCSHTLRSLADWSLG
jgi:hypothetical protein